MSSSETQLYQCLILAKVHCDSAHRLSKALGKTKIGRKLCALLTSENKTEALTAYEEALFTNSVKKPFHVKTGIHTLISANMVDEAIELLKHQALSFNHLVDLDGINTFEYARRHTNGHKVHKYLMNRINKELEHRKYA